MTKVLEEFKMELVMDVALEGVVDKEVTKQVEVYKELVMDMVVEEVNRELLKEFNEGLVKVYLCKVNKIKLEMVIDVVVDKEVTKVAEKVNKELVKECGYSTIRDDHLKMHMTVTVERSLLLANSATTPVQQLVSSRDTCPPTRR